MKIIKASEGTAVHIPRIENYLSGASAKDIWINPKLTYPVLFEENIIGMQTSHSLSPNEALVQVPNNILLYTNLLDSSSISGIIEAHPNLFTSISKSYEDLKLITFISFTLSSKEASEWYDYITSLPDDLEVLYYGTHSELEELQDSDLAHDSMERLSKLDKAYSKGHTAVSQYKEYFEESYLSGNFFKWAWNAIGTRAFGQCLPCCALVPVAELFNHKNVMTTFYYSFQSEGPPDSKWIEPELASNYDDDEALNEIFSSIKLSAQKLYKISESAFCNEEFAYEYNCIKEEAKLVDKLIRIRGNYDA